MATSSRVEADRMPAAAVPESAPERGGFPGSPLLDRLRTADGRAWATERRGLAARWRLVWVDVAARYVLLALGFAAACGIAATAGNVVGMLCVPLTGTWMGFWFASLVLFIHEAAHYNVHPRKEWNDRLANAFIAILIGDDVRHYRSIHWQHHLHLGDVHDTEVSYRWAPTARFFLETLSGVHAWRVFKVHRRAALPRAAASRSSWQDLAALGRGMLLHGAIVGGAALAGWWSASVAWVVAVAVVFPYLSALRQQLEHRAADASTAIDYGVVPHGAVNRMFADGVWARAFGSAGFRRHLLHHWDPTISYTRFDEFERFVLTTPLAAPLDEARTSYLAAWRALARG
jgi:fatty acid desaturase